MTAETSSEPYYTVLLGAEGWLHPGWQGEFYPDDLPEDWRLAYYCTQLHAVFLPHPVWSGAAETEIRQWLEDTQPGFRFVLEPGPAGVADTSMTALFGDRLGRIAPRADPHLLWFDAKTDLRQLKVAIDAAPKPLYLFSRDAHLPTLRQVATLIELMGY